MSTLNTTSLKNQNSSTNNLILGSNGSVLFGSEGTAAEPSIAFNSDTDTGLYSPGANQLALATGGSGRLFVDSSGRVGIGTTSPGVSLDVVGQIKTSLLFNVNGEGFIRGDAAGELRIQGGTSGTVFRNNANNTEQARIDSSGRLLVGASSARLYTSLGYARFQVEGTAFADSSIGLTNNQATVDGSYLVFNKTRGTAVGGTTIVASGDQLGAIWFQGADGSGGSIIGATIKAEVDATPGTSDMPGRLVFSTTADGASSPTERMRISSAGVLSVGTASVPSGTHTITWQGANRCSFGNMDTTAANAYGIGILYGGGVAPNGTGNEFLYCADNAAIRATIRSNGGFANYSANDVNLSDRNTKKDVTLSPGTWDCLKEWEIVHFRYKEQPDDADLSLGVIAQQIEEHCPEVVTVFQEEQEAKEAIFDEEGNVVEPAQEAKPERIGVKEQQMMWMAIKALQEAQLRIEQLEASNSNLLTRVTALEAI